MLTQKHGLFKWDGHSWIAFPLPSNMKMQKFEFVAEDDIWASVRSLDSYREQLYHFTEDEWQLAEIPNVERFNNFLFDSPETGWVSADWGEIFRYEKGKWRQVPSPTRCHIKTIFLGPTNDLFALTDCPNRNGLKSTKGILSQILTFRDNEWITVGTSYHELEFPVTTLADTIWFFTSIPDTLARWDGTRLTFDPKLVDFHRVAFFADSSGYFTSFDSVYAFNSPAHFLAGGQGITRIPDKEANLISISQDGGVWFYGKYNIWEQDTSEFVPELTANTLSFQKLDIPLPVGGAFLQITEEKDAIYVVVEGRNNALVMLPYYLNQPEVDLVDVEIHNLNEPHRTYLDTPNYDFSVLAADFNNDGREDIFLTSLYSHNSMFYNLGNEKFLDVTEWAGVRGGTGRYGSAATADIDNDGDLDLFIPDEYGNSLLLKNNGAGVFSPHEIKNGSISLPGAKAASFADIDSDGWMDLAVTTYGKATHLYKNGGKGSFINITAKNPDLALDPVAKCTGLTFIDYDNDGDFDLYISKLLYSNRLLENNGSGGFKDVTVKVGLQDSSLTHGAAFFDIENSGYLDLILSNRGANQLFINQKGSLFLNESKQMGNSQAEWNKSVYFAQLLGGFSNGIVVFDAQDDGDLDAFLLNYDSPSTIRRNNHSTTTKPQMDFIQFELEGVLANKSAIGATVVLSEIETEANQPQKNMGIRHIESSSSFASHSQKLIHYGVDSTRKYNAVIQFPGGKRIELSNLDPGTRYSIKELESLASIYHEAHLKMKNWLLGFRGNLNLLLLGAGLLASILINWVGIHYFFMKKRSYIIFLLFWTTIFCVHYFFTFIDSWIYVTLPLVLACLACMAYIFADQRVNIQQLATGNSDILLYQLSAFAHNTKFANTLSSLEFHLNNSAPNETMRPEVSAALQDTIQLLLNVLSAEMNNLISHFLLRKRTFHSALGLANSWRNLRSKMQRINRNLKTNKALQHSLVVKSQENIRITKGHLLRLREMTYAVTGCNVFEVISRFVKDKQNEKTSIKSSIQTLNYKARISANELNKILEELYLNAQRAMKNKVDRDFELRVCGDDNILIEVSDSGHGIPRDEWDLVYKTSYTTRQNGGFGLYSVRKTLKVVGGRIQIVKSDANGTCFRVSLQKAIESD